MQERNKKLFSSFFLSFLFSLPLTFFSYLLFSFQHIHPPPQTHFSYPVMPFFFFFLSYCIGTISQFPSLSLFNHPGFQTGIKLSVAHHSAGMSGTPQLSFPRCFFHWCLLQQVSLTLCMAGVTGLQGRAMEAAVPTPPKASQPRWRAPSTRTNSTGCGFTRSLHSPGGQLTRHSGNGFPQPCLDEWFCNCWRPQVVQIPFLSRIWWTAHICYVAAYMYQGPHP